MIEELYKVNNSHKTILGSTGRETSITTESYKDKSTTEFTTTSIPINTDNHSSSTDEQTATTPQRNDDTTTNDALRSSTGDQEITTSVNNSNFTSKSDSTTSGPLSSSTNYSDQGMTSATTLSSTTQDDQTVTDKPGNRKTTEIYEGKTSKAILKDLTKGASKIPPTKPAYRTTPESENTATVEYQTTAENVENSTLGDELSSTTENMETATKAHWNTTTIAYFTEVDSESSTKDWMNSKSTFPSNSHQNSSTVRYLNQTEVNDENTTHDWTVSDLTSPSDLQENTTWDYLNQTEQDVVTQTTLGNNLNDSTTEALVTDSTESTTWLYPTMGEENVTATEEYLEDSTTTSTGTTIVIRTKRSTGDHLSTWTSKEAYITSTTEKFAPSTDGKISVTKTRSTASGSTPQNTPTTTYATKPTKAPEIVCPKSRTVLLLIESTSMSVTFQSPFDPDVDITTLLGEGDHQIFMSKDETVCNISVSVRGMC